MLIRDVLEIKGDCANFAIEPDAPASEAVSRMVENGVGSLLVIQAGDLVGFISERDLLRGLHVHGEALGGVKVSALMEREPVLAGPDDSIDYARDAMTRSRISHLVVMEEGRVVGVVSFHDVARASLKEANFENTLLKRYIKNWPE